MRKNMQAERLSGPVMEDQPLGKVREQAEREHILSVLERTRGSRAPAARILGISRKTLWKKLKRLGVSWPPNVPHP